MEIDAEINHLVTEMVVIQDILSSAESSTSEKTIGRLLDAILLGRSSMACMADQEIPDILKDHWLKYCDLMALKDGLGSTSGEMEALQGDALVAWELQREEENAQNSFKLAKQFHDDIQLACDMSASEHQVSHYGDLDDGLVPSRSIKGKEKMVVPSTPPAVSTPLCVETQRIVKECPICMEQIDALYDPRRARVSLAASSSKTRVLGLTLPCGHSFCSGCFKMYMQTCVESRRIPLPCPMDGCIAKISSAFLEPYYGHLSSYIKYAELEFLHQSNDSIMYCPSKKCNHPVIKTILPSEDDHHSFFDSEQDSDLTAEEMSLIEVSMVRHECPHCSTSVCTECKTFWHNGLTCEQFQALPEDERSKEDAQLHSLVSKKQWKRCPTCRIVVERRIGCNYMHCRCGAGFCYKCGSLYKSKTATANNVHGQVSSNSN